MVVKSTFQKVLPLVLLSVVVSACGEEEKKPAAAAPQKEMVAPVAKPEPAATPAPVETVMKAAEEVVAKVEEKVKDVAPVLSPEVRGEKVFKKCKACHDVKEGGRHKVGPNLFGVVGRAAGGADGFKKYSDAMVAYGQVWTPALIAEYVENPTEFLKEKTQDAKAKSAMAFKLKGDQARLDVAAYLETLK